MCMYCVLLWMSFKQLHGIKVGQMYRCYRKLHAPYSLSPGFVLHGRPLAQLQRSAPRLFALRCDCEAVNLHLQDMAFARGRR